jgi:uncharacterized protein with ATP-grasp and redox domains
MKALDPIPQCVDCLKSMARDVVQLIDPSDPMVLEKVERISHDIINNAEIDWDSVSSEFLDLIASADLVVSKGMANFETLYPKAISAPSFYLFKIKCDPIHHYIQAPLGSFMALWKDGK